MNKKTIIRTEMGRSMSHVPEGLKIEEDPDEGGFVAYFPELPGCITCGETIESVIANALDAKKEWIAAKNES